MQRLHFVPLRGLTRCVRHAPLFGVLALASPACSSSSPERGTAPFAAKPDDGGSAPEVDAGDEESADQELLARPDDGVQVSIVGTSIAPGDDIEWCEVQEFPGEAGKPYYVNQIDVAKSQYSHHVFITAAKPGTPAEAAATALGVGNRKNCLTAASAFGDGIVTVGAAAKSEQSAKFPPGVGQIYYGGQKLVVDYHYANTSLEPVDAHVAVNFHLVDASAVKKVAHGFGVMNLTIDIPPHGNASFTSECLFNHDVLVGGLARHTHRWGTTYKVWSVDEKDVPTLLWTTEDWQNDIEKRFDAPMLMKAHTGFRYECSYANTEDHALRFGEKTTDEMCNLFGVWWVVNEDDTPGPQNCLVDSVDADGIGRKIGGDTGPFNAISD